MKIDNKIGDAKLITNNYHYHKQEYYYNQCNVFPENPFKFKHTVMQINTH